MLKYIYVPLAFSKIFVISYHVISTSIIANFLVITPYRNFIVTSTCYSSTIVMKLFNTSFWIILINKVPGLVWCIKLLIIVIRITMNLVFTILPCNRKYSSRSCSEIALFQLYHHLTNYHKLQCYDHWLQHNKAFC